MSKRASTAFVLSGGASLGAIQVGMLRALYERGIAPDLIVGTSAGALNGAFIASRPADGRDRRRARRASGAASSRPGLPAQPADRPARLPRLPRPPRARLRAAAADRPPRRARAPRERLPLPLHVVAVDVITGEELRLSSGPLVDAVMASAVDPGRARRP